MAPVTKKNIKPHLSHVHPNHHLIHNTDDQANYICDACKTSGFGDRFRCHVCVADIHVYCADCPGQLSSFFHNHPLSLICPKPHTFHRSVCDICRESIDGVFYRCHHCGFHVHPLCTQLPEKLRHVIDDHHTLRLHKSSFGSCGVCGIDCSSLWVYGCHTCRVNIHLKCLRKPYSSKGTSSSNSGSRGIPHAPPPSTAGQPPFHCGFPPGYGENYYYYGYGGQFPWGYPNFNFWYPGYPFPAHNNIPNHPPNHGGGHGHGHGHGHESSSSSNWGSLFGNTMFSLIGNIASGAINGFLFGSIGF